MQAKIEIRTCNNCNYRINPDAFGENYCPKIRAYLGNTIVACDHWQSMSEKKDTKN